MRGIDYTTLPGLTKSLLHPYKPPHRDLRINMQEAYSDRYGHLYNDNASIHRQLEKMDEVIQAHKPYGRFPVPMAPFPDIPGAREPEVPVHEGIGRIRLRWMEQADNRRRTTIKVVLLSLLFALLAVVIHAYSTDIVRLSDETLQRMSEKYIKMKLYNFILIFFLIFFLM